MGTKRVGLARVEALIEGLKRDLDLSSCTISGGLQVTPAILTPAESVTLTKAANANRVNIIPSVATGNDEYVLPTPSAVGESYRFIWGGQTADADDIIFRAAAADGLTFSGAFLDVDENDAAATQTNMVHFGADDDKLQLTNPSGFDLTFIATSLTNYCVTGVASSSDTSAAPGDLA